MPDARLSNYRLERLLGSGGMGSVYLARDLALDRPVAIKFISPEKAGDEGARRRLIREARAAATLDHPNICAVHQVIVEPDGRACIVMQYVEGETLAARLRSGPLDPRLALSVTCDLAAALSAAHKRGIVHRDLKPQNVIITNDRRAKLLDFGIARVSELPTSTGGDDTATNLTVPGMFVGTPPYMSPEQFQQQPLDGRSDLFALGALFFECLTGRRAFDGRSQIEIFTQVLNSHPPVVSAVRPELTDRYDEVCRRLLAKHPDDRFRSAEELLGALRVLSPDTARSAATPVAGTAPAGGGGRFNRRLRLTAMASAIILAAVGVWKWNGSGGAVDNAGDASDYYRRGTERIRDGSYHIGRQVLLETVKIAPAFPGAYVRLAEANTELDDVEGAKEMLLKVDGLVADGVKVSDDDRLRVRAVRALMLREMDQAVKAYGELATLHPNDPGAWLDLGRAQDASALPQAARASFDQALQINNRYAAAYLRRATLLALQGEHDAALEDFAEAERLYSVVNDFEGRAEVLLRRGTFLNGIGRLREARASLERARDLAVSVGSDPQEIRAQLQLGSVTASEGQFAQAQAISAKAVEAARQNDLDTTAAEGLIDLANALFATGNSAQAASHLESALTLGARRGATRVIARATVQKAAFLMDMGRKPEAIRLAEEALPSIRQNRYRRYELKALSVIARGRGDLGQFEAARSAAKDVHRMAAEIKDVTLIGEALETLAGVATATGALPEALAYRTEGEALHREHKDAALAYDLANRAELLIRLGRPRDAEPLLAEIDAGIAQKVDAYVGRARRAASLRALIAATTGRHQEASRFARRVVDAPEATSDGFGRLALRILEYSDARAGRHVQPADIAPTDKIASPASREIRYWALGAQLAADDAARALAGATATLDDPAATVSPEFEWRVAAIGAAAARRLKSPAAGDLTARARRALGRVRADWKQHASAYEARPDMKELQRRAGLNTQS